MPKNSLQTHSEKTSAANKSIGFEFQFYYFLYRLLMLDEGESVGLEVEDDVSTKLKNDRQILIQLKHSVQEAASGNVIALTTLDIDLWKTLSNWSKVIRDENDGRKEKRYQLAFVKKTDFLLASNKSQNENNEFLKTIRRFHNDEIDIAALRKYLVSLQTTTKNDDIKAYIEDVLKLDIDVAREFMSNLDFELDMEDIVGKCKKKIKVMMIDDSRLDEIFLKLDSQLRQDNYEKVKLKKHIAITFDEFHARYRRYFELARSSELQIEALGKEVVLNAELEKQRFITQLIDIGDLKQSDTSRMFDYTRMLLKTRNNLDNWLRLGLVTKTEVESLHSQAKQKWQVEFDYHHEDISTDEAIKKNCRKLLYALRREEIKWTRGALDLEVSNGEFYYLSDIPEIGWHPEWKDKYK